MGIKSGQILILDDDRLTLDAMSFVLSTRYQTHAFTDPSAAEEFLSRKTCDVALLDLNFPAHNGLELLQTWKHKFPSVEIISCSAEVRIERAMQCLREGASDYLVKPFSGDSLLRVVTRTLEKRALRKKADAEKKPDVNNSSLVGEAAKLREVVEKIELLRHQEQLNVLILGESGTGKEVVARLLHSQEGNASRPFIVANMPAIPSTLMESELFGVEKGSYTDAKASRPGKFELADRGDIFLDEIGDLALDTQAKILRVIQEKQVDRIGALSSRQVSFRVIAATNRPLADLIAGGKFREDLMYRLSDMVLWLPALRERAEDIPLLTRHFLTKHGGKREITASDAVMKKLASYSWPGNVRQLESTIRRAIAFANGSRLESVEIFDPTMLNPAPPVRSDLGYAEQVEMFEKFLIEDRLRRNSGDTKATMQDLKLSRATFYRKVSQLGISLGTTLTD